MANGAKELLDEVASGKITGEEDAFSHTDLSDFKANVDGAEKVFELLTPIAKQKDADLVTTLTKEFGDVQDLLAKYEDGDTYVSYDEVTESQRKDLSDAVNALAEPLSKLAAAVV
jgi:iron uptake system component EfeO